MERKLDLTEVKSIMLDILIDLQRVCDENDIKLFLAYGTLLGAVRHKGFIPWDDDVDVLLLRDDYEKLIRIYNDKKGKSYYKLCCLENDCAWIPFSKIVDLRTRTNYSIPPRPEAGGVWVDIFPLDGFHSSRLIKTYQYVIAKMFTSQIAMANSDWRGKQKGFDKINKIAVNCFRTIGIARISKWAIKHAKRFSIDVCDMVNCLAWAAPIKEETPKNDFQRLEPVYFEGHEFHAMRNYDEWLRHCYGDDYMELPPDEKRVNHHFDAFIDTEWKN